MRTNMNVGALDRREKGETTLIQTTDLTATISIPRSLKWNEITFPANWTLENENHALQILNPAQNPDLDFVQQLADGTVRLSFDRSRLSTPLDYEYRQPLDTSQFRSPINRLSFVQTSPVSGFTPTWTNPMCRKLCPLLLCFWIAEGDNK